MTRSRLGRFRPRLSDLPGVLAMLLVLASASALAVPSNKWRLEVSGGASSDGEIVLAVKPEAGLAAEVVVPIGRADSENQVAAKIADALDAAAGADYAVERDDGEDVLVKRRAGAGLFEVTLVRNTVAGVRIAFDPE